MDFLTHLWIPILASGGAVWFASALAWMLIGHHNKDVAPIPNEQQFTDTIKSLGIAPGNYGFPDFQKCKNAPKDQKPQWGEGPMGLLRVWGPVNMGANMLFTFLFFLVVSVVIGYLGWAALNHEHESFKHVFRVLGTAGVLAYCAASFPNDLWFQRSRRAMLMNLIDGIAFGLITGAMFAWLWPHA